MINIAKYFQPDNHGFKYPEAALSRARQLNHEGRFQESNRLLEILFSDPPKYSGGPSVCDKDLFALYGWNLLFQQKREELARFLGQFSPEYLNANPEILVISLWSSIRDSNLEEIRNECVGFIENNISPVNDQVPYFKFLLAYTESKLGLLDDAVANGEISFALFSLQKDPQGCGWAGNFLGIVHLQRGDYREAGKWFGRSLGYYNECGLVRKQSMVFLNMGVVNYKTGEYRESFRSLHKSLQIGVEGGWIHRQCFANIALGNVYRLTRDMETARKHLHVAYNQAQGLGFRREDALSLEFLGDVYRDEGRPGEARRFYKRALAIAVDIAPEGDIVMEVQRRLGECFALEDNPNGAAEHLTRALHMARAQGDRFEEGVTLRVMAETNFALGDLPGAIKTITRSVDLLNEIGAKHELAISLLRRGDLRLMQLDATKRACGLPARALILDEAWEDATHALDLLLGVNVSWWTEKARNLADRVSRGKTALEREQRTAQVKSGGDGRHLSPDLIIHTSGVMRDLIQLCDLCAGGSDPVLIVGETGTGKELIARRVHEHSDRSDRPLVTVNVAAIASSMFEREFFGHTRGSFSGAVRDGKGFAASADGGTLFLDEIGELPREMQPKLLRLIQDGTYQALGDPRLRRSDLRLVAATNADLKGMVDRGEFRSDLYFRLKVLELHMPPVRERRDDILPLLRHFLSVASGRPVEPIEFFSSASLDRLLDYDWPGNVREISMVARRAVVEMKARGRVHLNITGETRDNLLITGPDHRLKPLQGGTSKIPDGRSVKTERARILMALEECGGNRIAASRKLGVGRSTLYRRMTKLGIPTRKESD